MNFVCFTLTFPVLCRFLLILHHSPKKYVMYAEIVITKNALYDTYYYTVFIGIITGISIGGEMA